MPESAVPQHWSESTRVRRETRPSVLLADDDPELRQLVTMVLREDGYDVTQFSRGDTLLEFLASALLDRDSQVTPDLAIVDVRMPGFSGLEILSGLHFCGPRRRSWTLPVVVITACEEHEMRLTAAKYGAAAFLQKPFDLSVLRSVVQCLVEGPS